MKKQNNSVNALSVKSMFSVTLLCALLGGTEIKASTYQSAYLNNITKEVKTEPKNENALNGTSVMAANPIHEAIQEEEISDVISRWMSGNSFWSSEVSESTYVFSAEVKEKVAKTEVKKAKIQNTDKIFLFNAENYIVNSEF